MSAPTTSPAYHLFHYWRSSASWRMRMVLEYKGIAFTESQVSLVNGESESEEHLKRNPAGYVPVLELKTGPHTGKFLTESLAIILYLEEMHPGAPTVLPGDAFDHAQIWSLAETINSGAQPIINPPVMGMHSKDPDEQKRWMQHWINRGLDVFEKLSTQFPGNFSYGNAFSLADVCLMPHLYAAERFEVSLEPYPRIRQAWASCKALPAYEKSHPAHYEPKE